MARVLERFLRRRRLADIRLDPWLQEAASLLVACDQATEVNWACLDLAATVCQAKRPRCQQCSVAEVCNYGRAEMAR